MNITTTESPVKNTETKEEVTEELSENTGEDETEDSAEKEKKMNNPISMNDILDDPDSLFE